MPNYHLGLLRQKYPDFDLFFKEIQQIAKTVTQGNLEAAYKLATYDHKQEEYKEKLAHLKKELNKQQSTATSSQKKEKEEKVASSDSKKELNAQCFQNIGGMINFVGYLPIIFENESKSVSKVTDGKLLGKSADTPKRTPLKSGMPIVEKDLPKEEPEAPLKPHSGVINDLINKQKKQGPSEKELNYWIYQLGNDVQNIDQILNGSIPKG